jgi:hypothetical protein
VFETASLRPCCLVVRQPCMPRRASWPYSSSTDGHGGQLHIHTTFNDAPLAEVLAADIACGPTAAAVHVRNSKLKTTNKQQWARLCKGACSLQRPERANNRYMKPCQCLNRSTEGSIAIRNPAAALPSQSLLAARNSGALQFYHSGYIYALQWVETVLSAFAALHE